MRITEKNFVAQLNLGNQEALAYVIDNYAWILKTVIKKHLFYLPNMYEECMNDCLLAIWDNIDSYNPEKSSFKNWIAGIAKYKSIDYVRKYLKDLDNKKLEDITLTAEEDSLKMVLTRELEEEIGRILNNLPGETREIFNQIYYEGKSYNEIAEGTGLSKSVLYNRISRGKKKIKKELKGGYLK